MPAGAVRGGAGGDRVAAGLRRHDGDGGRGGHLEHQEAEAVDALVRDEPVHQEEAADEAPPEVEGIYSALEFLLNC